MVKIHFLNTKSQEGYFPIMDKKLEKISNEIIEKIGFPKIIKYLKLKMIIDEKNDKISKMIF